MSTPRVVVAACMCALALACGGHDTAKTPMNRPAAEMMAPGRLTMEVTGAKVARTEMREVSYCIMQSPGVLGPVRMFELVGANDAWGVALTATSPRETAGRYRVADRTTAAYNATVTDKSHGSRRAEWQRYRGSAGSVLFTEVTSTTVAGTFVIQADPQWPQTNGPSLDVTGNFAAVRAHQCEVI